MELIRPSGRQRIRCQGCRGQRHRQCSRWLRRLIRLSAGRLSYRCPKSVGLYGCGRCRRGYAAGGAARVGGVAGIRGPGGNVVAAGRGAAFVEWPVRRRREPGRPSMGPTRAGALSRRAGTVVIPELGGPASGRWRPRPGPHGAGARLAVTVVAAVKAVTMTTAET